MPDYRWRLFELAILMFLVPRSLAQVSRSADPATSDVGAATSSQRGEVPTCYIPDGTIAEGDYACNLSSNFSACCTIGAQCTESGLCYNDGNGYILRTSCTDRTWNSPECAHYCMEAKFGGTNLISCTNVTDSDLDFCCDHTNDCCETGVGRIRLAENGLNPITTIASSASTATRHPSSKTSRSSPSSTTSASSTVNPVAATTPSTSGLPTPQSTASALQSTASSGVSIGAAVGIGIGSACGAAGLLAIYLLWRRRKRRSASASQEKILHQSPRNPQELPGEFHPEMQAGNPVWEVSEAPGAHQHWELASRDPKYGRSSQM